MIGTRHPLIPNIDAHEPGEPYVLVLSDELDANIYELNYFLRELRLTLDLGFTPQSPTTTSVQSVCRRCCDRPRYFATDNRISEDVISFIDDEHGAGHYCRRTHL